MSKHTPGPWNFAERLETSGYMPICTPKWWGLAEVVVRMEHDTKDHEEGLANAHLIAAAPELLDALKACQLQLLQSNNTSEYAQEAVELANAAIEKANGVAEGIRLRENEGGEE